MKKIVLLMLLIPMSNLAQAGSYSITYPDNEIKLFSFPIPTNNPGKVDSFSDMTDVKIGGYQCTFAQSVPDTDGFYLETASCQPINARKSISDDIQVSQPCSPKFLALENSFLITENKFNLQAKNSKDAWKKKRWRIQFKCQ